jgi:hypothetical protein
MQAQDFADAQAAIAHEQQDALELQIARRLLEARKRFITNGPDVTLRLPQLQALLFQVGNQKRAVRLLGVFVSNLQTGRDGQIESITPLSLWDES